MRRLPTIRLAVPVAAALLAPSLTAQLQWQQVPTLQSPSPRYGHATVRWGITFGGRDETQAFADTWIFEGGAVGWRPMPTANAPSPRHRHAMDMDIDDTLMFGGADAGGVRNGETWRFTTTWMNVAPGQPFASSWTQLSPAHAPSPRDGHALAFDWMTATTALLFGGRTDAGLSDETWLWNGGDWQLLATGAGPSAREAHRLQPVVDGWLLFGGNDDAQALADCWHFDGSQWQQLADMPFAATGAAIAHLSFERQRVVFVGGRDQGGYLRDAVHEYGTWTPEWFEQPVLGTVPSREGASAVEQYLQLPSLETVMTAVVFGGRDAQGHALGDTLRLQPTNVAEAQLLGTGCGPGAWSNDGPELFLQRVILGNRARLSMFSHTPGALCVFGMQLGEAAAPQPCQVTVVPALLFFGLSSATVAQFVQDVTIPFYAPLRGQSLSLQGLVFEPAAANGIALSQVGVLRLGD
ncbi:MAG: hypothetical protein H6835_14890 [Planctomycetes bacterium]|nr:hypothetical protein [Planctomycetota bacterium]